MATVQTGKVVVIHYTLTRGDGSLVESTRGKDPLAYLHGKGHIVPGLERALDGQQTGSRIETTVPPEEGYGVRKGSGPQPVPKREFPSHIDLRVGLPLEIKGSDGEPVQVWVTRVKGAKVWIDLDHPLAGESLSFDVEIVGIRDPFPDELEHGHAHGPDGHHRH